MNKLLKISLIFGIVSFITPTYVFASCGDKLPRTLKQGMKGADVKVLQQFLNDFPETQISTSGSNSKGKENGVFDVATLKAFKKFQTTNYELVLKPAGLKIANGVVGRNSRAIINNSLCEDIAYVPSNSYVKTNSSAGSGFTASESEVLIQFDKDLALMKSKLNSINVKFEDVSGDSFKDAKNSLTSLQSKLGDYTGKYVTMDVLAKKVSDDMNKSSSTRAATKGVEITAILPFLPKTGSTIFIFATNLQSSNKVYIGNNVYIAKLAKVNDKFVTITVPANLIPGQYDVYVENTNGKSEVSSVQIAKSSNSLSTSSIAPSITSVSPTKGNVGTQVTMTGEKFTKVNTIHTTSKSYYDVVSLDGKTLKFTIEADSSLLGNGTKLMSTLPFTFFVRNEYGDSNVETLKLE